MYEYAVVAIPALLNGTNASRPFGYLKLGVRLGKVKVTMFSFITSYADNSWPTIVCGSLPCISIAVKEENKSKLPDDSKIPSSKLNRVP